MASRSAWEPRWKYQAGRQILCRNAAAEAALQGVWFDTLQPAHTPVVSGDLEIDVETMVRLLMPTQGADGLSAVLPKPERIKRKYVKKAEKQALLDEAETLIGADTNTSEVKYDYGGRTPLY